MASKTLNRRVIEDSIPPPPRPASSPAPPPPRLLCSVISTPWLVLAVLGTNKPALDLICRDTENTKRSRNLICNQAKILHLRRTTPCPGPVRPVFQQNTRLFYEGLVVLLLGFTRKLCLFLFVIEINTKGGERLVTG